MSKRPAPADPQGNGSPHKRTAQQTHIEYRKRQIRNVLPRIRAGDFDLDATSIAMLKERTFGTGDLALYFEVDDILEHCTADEPLTPLDVGPPTIPSPAPVNRRGLVQANAERQPPVPAPAIRFRLVAPASPPSTAFDVGTPSPPGPSAGSASDTSVATTRHDSAAVELNPAPVVEEDKPDVRGKSTDHQSQVGTTKKLTRVLEGLQMMEWLGEPIASQLAYIMAEAGKNGIMPPVAQTIRQLGLDSNELMTASIRTPRPFCINLIGISWERVPEWKAGWRRQMQKWIYEATTGDEGDLGSEFKRWPDACRPCR